MDRAFAADVIAAVHVGYVGFVVLGEAAILLGLVCRWRWIRNPWFRWLHLAAIVVVALEAALGVTCPLTVWERQLRAAAGQHVAQRSFVAQVAHRLLFFDLPEWSFRVLHVAFGALVVLTFVLAPPRRRRKAGGEK